METNIKNNQDQIFRPHIQKAKKVVLGQERPKLFTQIVFYLGIVGTSIFGMWSTISLLILKFPGYLKSNKQVDVEAIVGLRARELGFEGTDFFNKLVLFHLTSTLVWIIILICFFLLWRSIKWANVVIVAGIVALTLFTLILFGPTYLIEDTTTFDKITLLIMLTLSVISHFTMTPKQKEAEEIAPVLESDEA